MTKRNSADHGLPVQGSNDAAPGHGPHPYRTTPNLGVPAENQDYFPEGIPVVKSEERGKFGTRTGRNE